MNLTGRQVIFLGDSITQGCGTSSDDCRFTSLLERRMGLFAHNYGLGGTGIVPCVIPSENPQFDLDFRMRAGQIDDPADVFVIFGGINDFGRGHVPLGSVGDTTDSTFYGSLFLLYNFVKERWPNALIVAVTPIPYFEQDQPVGKNPALLCDYVTAIRHMADSFGFALLDLFETYPCDPRRESERNALMPDGVHPNDTGHQLLADAFQTFFEAL